MSNFPFSLYAVERYMLFKIIKLFLPGLSNSVVESKPMKQEVKVPFQVGA